MNDMAMEQWYPNLIMRANSFFNMFLWTRSKKISGVIYVSEFVSNENNFIRLFAFFIHLGGNLREERDRVNNLLFLLW